MELPELIRKTGQLADLEPANRVGNATQYRGEAHYPVTCFLELNCKNDVYLIYFGLYYDIFRFRFHEGKILYKGELREAKQYIEENLVNEIKPLRSLSPAVFLERGSPMPHGDMGICDEAFINSIKNFDGEISISELVGRIDALGASRRSDAADVLKPLLKHRFPSVRMHALTALLSSEKAPENDKLRAIIGTIEDPEKEIRELSLYCSRVMFKEKTKENPQTHS